MHHRVFVLTTLFFFVARTVSGQSSIQDVPTDPEDLRAVFVDAWLTFRNEMDGIASIKRTSTTIDALFEAMPDFLLNDVLRLATDHEVVYQAARAILKQANTQKNRALIRQLMQNHTDSAIGDQLSMLLVRSGDKPTIKSLVQSLKSPTPSERIRAAVHLAGGGENRGIIALKKSLQLLNEYDIEATAALGRYGPPNLERLLSSLLSQYPSRLHFKMALGEMAFRRMYPKHYKLFLVRHRFERRSYLERGLYETWMLSVYLATLAGASSPSEFRAALQKMTKEPPLDRDKEATRRQLSAFIDFWDHASACIAHPSVPPWPKRFNEAVKSTQRIITREDDPDQVILSRLSASIALIAATGKKIGYDTLASPTKGLRALSPSGERALDGNLTTSWQIRGQGRLVLEHLPNRHIDAIWIMFGCRDREHLKHQKITVDIDGISPNKVTWKLSKPIDITHSFFNNIPIDRQSLNRIGLTLSSSKAKNRLCIPEIRLTYHTLKP